MADSPRYMEQESAQTLREALDEYYRVNPNLLDTGELPGDAALMFRRHDAGHVVFGCDTSLHGETLIDTWTIFATTAGLRGYVEYFRYPQVNAIFAQAGYLAIAAELVRSLPDVARVIGASRRLVRKWPWSEYERFLGTPLSEIRREYRIVLV